MENIEFAKQLEKRTKIFAITIIKLSSLLPSTPEGRVIRNQITKSGTSIGANIEEAQAAQSRADFRSKISIAAKEARESHYWLRLTRDGKVLDSVTVTPLIDEIEAIKRILTSIVKSAGS